ncbi:TetR/AcrR family transcriptional regulator [Streptoalloteichus hindustanus]|uniref:Transcriptional regulator, TetR family n=1 Tax=Streptoalloteichus hindustanus TaxID=2017 RepID=A0A1M5AFC2_STRHI|nr:TetR/AcrR family transcriptional regulator [Streptoalloteichus hindustanus]SHF28834.1 transcriptional regulator, TetR family [Streptoalloteichus hindustanus]
MTRAAEGRTRRAAGELTPVEARIMRAAVRLFAEQGFDGTTVQQVVDAAEVTKGALYHYFESKDDLLYEIYHSLIAIQLAGAERILAAGAGPAETVRALVVDLVETTAAHVDEAAVFGREMHKLAAERMAAVRADRRRYHEAFRGVVERGQREGVFRAEPPAETVTLVALGVVNQLPSWYRPDGPKPPGQLGAEIADFVLAGLRPD